MARKSPPRKTSRKAPKTKRRSHWLLKLLLLVLLVAGASLYWLDRQVRQRFEAHEWVLPARVYSHAEELYRGRQLQPEHLQELLALMRYRRDAALTTPGTWYRDGDHFALFTRGFADTDGGEKPQRLLLTLADGRIAKLADSNGSDLAVSRIEPLQIGSIHPGFTEDRVYVKLDAVPPALVALLLSTEDRYFYSHHGISMRGLLRAVYVDITSGRLAQGGSTLTQQLVKNLWLTRERSLLRKLTEIPMAVLLELHYSKPQILEAYLNEAYVGQDGDRAIHGMGLGAQFFFGRPLDELDTSQLALLVGLLRGPSYYDPRRHPERALARRNGVLRKFLETGGIDEATFRKLAQAPLGVVPQGNSALYAFPAFVDLVRRQLDRDYSAEQLSRNGLRIYTTLDVLAQLAAERSLSGFLQQQDPDGRRQFNGAVVVVAPDQGDVLALVGDRVPRRAGYNRALDAQRPIGSLAKPFVLLAALADPRYTLATQVQDEPLTVQLGGGKSWSPENFDHVSLGQIPLLKALTDSRNQATVQVGMAVGPQAVADWIMRMQAGPEIPPYPSLLLGGFSLSPLQVAMLYQPLANGGFRTPLRTITDILDQDGKPLARYPAAPQQVIPAGLNYLVTWGMQQVVAEGTGRAANELMPDLHLAGKTGTSNDLRDSWFAGFSGSTLAVAWIGRDDNKLTGMTGATGALRVWAPLMAQLPERALAPRLPDDVQNVWMNADGVRRSSALCSGSREYPLLKASIPEDADGCGDVEKVQKGVFRWFKGLFGR